ncbi:STAS domain-containing protein, partial [Streptomyces sp. NPDC057654]|uniref:STAS domain-containing protein n=1 Tax=Streptomyces sp. NPDC057654 TaxID=3346196 RepID=UPI0036955A74
PRLRELLRMAQGPGVRLVLDLSGVTHCDVLALGVLVATARRARFHGGELRILAPSPAVSRALGTGGLRRRLSVFPEAGAPVARRAGKRAGLRTDAERPAVTPPERAATHSRR